MRRREFIGLLISAWPLAVLAQTKRRPLVGWLWYSESDLVAGYLKQLLNGMRELGLVEGRDFDMVYRSAEFHVERLPRAAEELVQLNPDIIVASATLQAVAVKKATDTIPIVVPVLADPVGLGFVTSEARPSGNVTGIAPYVEGLPAKQLELAREVVPGATRIGLVDDVNDPKAHPQRREIEAAGKELEIKIVLAEVRTAIKHFGFSEEECRVVPGWFSDSLPPKTATLGREGIALLRVDCDWYEPVRFVLDTLVSHTTDDARVILDDYYFWDGCARATHDFLASSGQAYRIRTIGEFVGAWFEKKAGRSGVLSPL
jgi:hypothetical protein